MRGAQPSLPGIPTPHDALAQAHRAHVGAEAETFVDDLHDHCRLARVAEVHRVASNVKITKRLERGRVEGVLTGKSVVDYMGWTMRGPTRPVAVEVKHVDVAPVLKSGLPAAWRFPLAHLAEHQAGMLERLDAAGGLALLLVVHGGQAYPVPWRVVAQARAAGAASLGGELLQAWRHTPGQPYLLRFLAR